MCVVGDFSLNICLSKLNSPSLPFLRDLPLSLLVSPTATPTLSSSPTVAPTGMLDIESIGMEWNGR